MPCCWAEEFSAQNTKITMHSKIVRFTKEMLLEEANALKSGIFGFDYRNIAQLGTIKTSQFGFCYTIVKHLTVIFGADALYKGQARCEKVTDYFEERKPTF